MPYLLTQNSASPTNWIQLDSEFILDKNSSSVYNSNCLLQSERRYEIPVGHGHRNTSEMVISKKTCSEYSLHNNIQHINYNWKPKTNSLLESSNNFLSNSFPKKQRNFNIEDSLYNTDDLQLENQSCQRIKFTTFKFKIQRYLGYYLCGFLSAFSILSPIIMIVLPQLKVFEFRESQLKCEVNCHGLFINLSFKVLILSIGSWALLLRTPRATFPRIHLYRTLFGSLLILLNVIFWLFYVNRVAQSGKRKTLYVDIVVYASSMVDTLLFIHYLAVYLVEIQCQTPQYFVKVIRSPDGESKYYKIGSLSIQEAAAWILEKYYIDFSIYNPIKSSLTCTANQRDGLLPFYQMKQESKYTDFYKHFKRESVHNERLFQEIEYSQRVKRREARLITSTSEAFSQFQRLKENSSWTHSSRDGASFIYPLISRSLFKFLRVTHSENLHSSDSLMNHLIFCLKHQLSPMAFLEKIIVASPVLQNDAEQSEIQSWSLISDTLLTRFIAHETVFELRQGDLSLMVSIAALPHIVITEENEFEKDIIFTTNGTSV